MGWKQLQRRDMEGEHTWTDMSDCGNTRREMCGHRRETQNNDPTKTHTDGEGAMTPKHKHRRQDKVSQETRRQGHKRDRTDQK